MYGHIAVVIENIFVLEAIFGNAATRHPLECGFLGMFSTSQKLFAFLAAGATRC